MILLDIILKFQTCLDCPGGTSHGNLCCELDYVSKRNMSQTGGRSQFEFNKRYRYVFINFQLTKTGGYMQLVMKYFPLNSSLQWLSFCLSPDADAGAHLGAVVVDTDVAAECLAQVNVAK